MLGATGSDGENTCYVFAVYWMVIGCHSFSGLVFMLCFRRRPSVVQFSRGFCEGFYLFLWVLVDPLPSCCCRGCGSF